MTIRSYASANDYLGGKGNRPLQNNTRLIRLDEETIVVRLHETDVVTYHRNGEIVLNSGGWRTQTTRDRINTNSPMNVTSEKGVWWVNRISLFYDGITINAVHNIVDVRLPDEKQTKADAKMLAQINRYVDGFAKAMMRPNGIPLPDGGDCWFCYMKDEKTGLTFGDMGDNDHLISHMRDKYYVPSLLVNALEEKGYPIPMLIFQMDNQYKGPGRPSSSTMALRTYLKRRLLPESNGAKPVNPKNIRSGVARSTRFEVHTN